MTDYCLFVSDLHGKVNRYERFFKLLEKEKPLAVFFGGDLLPSSILHSFRAGENMPDFVTDYLADKLQGLKDKMGTDFPEIYLIFGNDDPRIEESAVFEHEKKGLWNYVHNKAVSLGDYYIMGYAFVPPTPFLLKDWEKYDIDKQVQPGCIHPTEGFRTFDSGENIEKTTIRSDLKKFPDNLPMERTVFLFHSPPYQTGLDRAALDGIKVEENDVDVHVGSKAIKEFIEQNKPYLTLHGHIHESSRLTGVWKEKLDQTIAISAAFEGPGLAVVKFRLSDPYMAERIIL
jgi:uncharacterized protein